MFLETCMSGAAPFVIFFGLLLLLVVPLVTWLVFWFVLLIRNRRKRLASITSDSNHQEVTDA